jgi:hypothetical protein
MLENY